MYYAKELVQENISQFLLSKHFTIFTNRFASVSMTFVMEILDWPEDLPVSSALTFFFFCGVAGHG